MSVLRSLSITVTLLLSGGGHANALTDIADRCEAALLASDRAAFEAVVEAVRPRKDVFDIAARKRVEACLSEGFGEPWEYSFPEREWLPVAEAQARIQARKDVKLAKEQAAADADAERQANSDRVAALIYASCGELLTRDQVAAMTNAVCIESFLLNGLPPQ